MKRKKIDVVFGTRPEAIKMAPLVRVLHEYPDEFETRVILTAQHREMLDQVMRIFNLDSDVDLDIMQAGQTLTSITIRGLERLEPVFRDTPADLVLVHGDTSTTLVASLAAFYQKIPVAHVEAGLRSFDIHNPYPEEINRRLCDAICDLHFAPTDNAMKNLLQENIPEEKIFITGNTGIDGLNIATKQVAGGGYKYLHSDLAKILDSPFILLTVHRRENIGEPLANLCKAVEHICRKRPDMNFIYPVHLNPAINDPVHELLGSISNVHLLPPLEYSDFVALLQRSTFVVTDSGGIQEEAPSLGKPVLVLRKVTERPEAVDAGTVRVIGTELEEIIKQIENLLDDQQVFDDMARAVNPYGDGLASSRIVEAIRYYFGINSERPDPFVP